MTRAILHIGAEKTGSTALQVYLTTNRKALTKHGYFYSRAAGWQNHASLCRYALPAGARNAPGRLKPGVTHEEFRQALENSLAEEAARHPESTLLFSNEHCRGRLVTAEQVADLHRMLAGLFDDISVVVYIRRQDELAVSYYSTMLKSGGVKQEIIPSRPNSDFYDYWGLLQRWGSVFGEANIDIGIFGRASLEKGSIVADFCKRTGIPELPTGQQRSNEAMPPDQQEYLREINIRIGNDETITDADRHAIRGLVSSIGGGKGRMPSQSEARAFYERFAESNEKVRARYFPERATLFNEDFSAYPETAADPELNLEAALDIGAAVATAAIAERNRLRAEIAALRKDVRPANG